MGGQNFVTLGPVPDCQNDGVQQAAINVANQNNNSPAATIVSAVAGKRIFVHGFMMGFTGNARVSFLDATTAGATVTQINGNGLYGLAFQTMIVPYQQYPWFTVSSGDSLCLGVINATTVSIGGNLLYTQG